MELYRKKVPYLFSCPMVETGLGANDDKTPELTAPGTTAASLPFAVLVTFEAGGGTSPFCLALFRAGGGGGRNGVLPSGSGNLKAFSDVGETCREM